MDWRDLRIALALERHRSLLEAGRSLKLDPTTVSRRVTALEAALGAPLFERAADGWRPTEAGRRVVEHAARMAQEARALSHDVDAAAERVRGVVRLTTLDYVAAWFFAPRLAELRARHPELVLEVRCTEHLLDLRAGQADIAVRLVRPTEAGLRARRLADVPLGLYGARGLVERLGPDPLAGPTDLVVMGHLDSTFAEIAWARALVPRGRIAAATTGFTTLFELVVHGVGLGVLPTRAADAHPELVRVDRDAPPIGRALWRVVPENLASAPRVRAVLDWLETAVATGAPAG